MLIRSTSVFVSRLQPNVDTRQKQMTAWCSLVLSYCRLNKQYTMTVSKNGLTNSVFTLYELSNGDDTENEEFHGLEESMLLRALQALQQEHRAEIITLDDGRGVKFFQ
ncbi:single-stranded DNA-binding protein [Platysternon megacephalum]|uniref:Vacuolar protein-sorting-associated protein 25 n=1 Tax=Platysternon megacephalum TaxID=55544 RepID=A0A4D9DDS1_9SAUR|nr:single-stranded DNA-binding protein [Platysternon megacephalum]